MESTDSLNVGDYVCFTWKKSDGSALGASEGLFIGCFGDDISGKFLVFDRSCYKGSFKTEVFSLGIHDLKIVPEQEIGRIDRRCLRDRPPNRTEKFSFLVDAFYFSNIDFETTICAVKTSFPSLKLKPIGNSNAEQYGLNVKGIPSASEASINLTCNGIVQITCQQANMDKCISWLESAVKLLPSHKRLVLFPKEVSYRIFDSFKEKSAPSAMLIKDIGLKEGPSVIAPLGWDQNFSDDLSRNALTDILDENKNSSLTIESKSKLTVEEFIGNKTPTIRLTGEILKQEEETGLLNMWEQSRSDVWQFFDSGPAPSGQIKAKVLIHDLAINKKTGYYKILIRSYYNNELSRVVPSKGIKAQLKTDQKTS
jgi:hypothetical protein